MGLKNQLKILAGILDGCPLEQPCNRMAVKPDGWCRDHCGSEQWSPDAECWLRYARIMDMEKNPETEKVEQEISLLRMELNNFIHGHEISKSACLEYWSKDDERALQMLYRIRNVLNRAEVVSQ